MGDLFNSGNLLNSNSNSNQTHTKKPANFIEALKEQGRAATSGIANAAADQLSGSKQAQEQNPEKKPNFDFAEFLKSRDQKIRSQERNLHQQQQRSETVLFNRQNEETKKQIEEIKISIKQILIATKDTSAELIEAEKTIMTTTVEVGTYQINFLSRVRRLIELAKKRISEANHWLDMFNTRNQHRSYYWGQVKKSGTKFMLSHERQIATQTG
jgi:uncharacterized protein DUF5660